MQTQVIKIDPLDPELDKIRDAALVLARGGLVAFPTETVYGLGANLLDEKAIKRLYAVKKRSGDKPLSIHIGKKESLEQFAKDIVPFVYRITDRFWPGPLTLVLKSKDGDKVGLRMPSNKIALNLLSETGVPVVAPSANISSNPPPMNAEDVLRDLDGKIEVLIDGGKVELGVESTVVDVASLPIKVLREGAIRKDVLEKISQTKQVLFVCTGNSCRSVMAKYLLEKQVVSLGKDNILVYSCGVSAIIGASATHFVEDLLKEEGLDARRHQAIRLSKNLLERSDLVLVMENMHKEEVNRLYPEFSTKVFLLEEFTNNKKENIGDPIGKPEKEYRECFIQIKNLVKRIAEKI